MGSISSQPAAAIASLVKRLESAPVALTRSGQCDPEAKQLMHYRATELFPHARNPQGALAGLLLIAGCWEQAHQISQEMTDAAGSYWHALVHRMEPETWNSDYWFGRAGSHHIFAALHAKAVEVIGQHPRVSLQLQKRWQPSLMNSWCDRARKSKDPELLSAVTEIHTSECWLLWRWCAAPNGA